MGRGPLKARHGSNMQPSPQNKGGTKVTSMLCVTDNKPGLIPYSLRKGLQLTLTFFVCDVFSAMSYFFYIIVLFFCEVSSIGSIHCNNVYYSLFLVKSSGCVL